MGKMRNIMTKNIYFVQNFHGIQHFLSLYEPGEQNLIVISNNKSLRQFLQEIMPNEEKIIVHQIPANFLGLEHPFYFFLFWRIYYGRLLKKIMPPAKAYFFSKTGNEHFYILIGYLARKGIDIKYVDAFGGNFYEERIEDQHLLSRLYLRILSIMGGVRLAKFQIRYGQCLGLANCVEPMNYRPNTWEFLSKKYHWTYKNESKNAILLVDDPRPGLNIKKTQQNLICFFTRLLNKGVQIHLKPHCDAPGINSFNGTFLEKEIKILPAYFPVELIMNQYQEVYSFLSFSDTAPIKGEKYSLAKLLVFNSKEEEALFWKSFGDIFGKEITKVKVKFIEINNNK